MSREHELAGRIERLEAWLELAIARVIPIYEEEERSNVTVYSSYFSRAELEAMRKELKAARG